MRAVFLPIAGVAFLALASCDEPAAETRTTTATAVAGSSDHGSVSINADSDTGKVAISLPGGIEAKVKMPSGMADGAKFDIDGIKLYPGARVNSVNVNANGSAGEATVLLGFNAPADAAAVADWYQQKFASRHIAASRSGDTLTGKTEDGDAFTLAMVQAETGNSLGSLLIRDKKAG